MKNFIKNIDITKFKKRLFDDQERGLWSNSMIIAVALLLGLFSVIIQFGGQDPKPVETSSPMSLDTYIPKGESLVPIQVANYESLDQVIGQFGVVDLLSTPLNPTEKAKRVAYAVKLIRSPKSPRHFSVLIPAEKAHKLAGYSGEFTVVVRNPKLLGTKFVKEKDKIRKRRIVYETEKL